MSTSNCILIDWLTFTHKSLTVDSVIDFMELNSVDWVTRSGHYGYRQAKFYGGIWILFDGADGMGICVEMSGQGCRQFETSSKLPSLSDFAKLIAKFPSFSITRLDVAYDDIDQEGNGLLDIRKIDRLARCDRYISKFGTKSGEWSGFHSDEGSKSPLALSVYFGSAKSDCRFRIYDKSLERGGLGYHWVRFELQLRRSNAQSFLLSDETVGFTFFGVVNNYLRFIVPDPNDSNRRRWKSPQWWLDFLEHTQRVSLYSKKDIEYNLTRLQRYTIGQAGASTLTYIKCVGLEKFMKEIAEKGDSLTDSQRALIAEWDAVKLGKLKEYWSKHPWG